MGQADLNNMVGFCVVISGKKPSVDMCESTMTLYANSQILVMMMTEEKIEDRLPEVTS